MKHIAKLIIAFIIAISTQENAFAQAIEDNIDNAFVYNKTDGAKLVGTWLVPEEGVMKAAVILATGSGQQDRDESLLGKRPFKAIAERLAKEGYGVLRLDDRGVGKSVGELENVTTDTFAGDILSGLEWLDSICPGVSKGVIGHSEGGSIAVKLAKEPICNFIITLGAPAMPGDSIVLTQGRAMMVMLTGRYDAEPLQKQLLAIAKSNLPQEEAKEKIMELMIAQLGPQAQLPAAKMQVEAQAEQLLTPWYRQFLHYDPSVDLKAVDIPWLALNGDKDFQVIPENLEIIGKLNPNVEIKLLPSHNHLFLECNTGLPQEYMSLKGDISDLTLETMVNWLNATVSGTE